MTTGKMTTGKLMAIGLVLAAVLPSSAAKRYIAYGWDTTRLDTDDFARNLDEMAKLPFDGICLGLRARLPDGKRVDYTTVMDGVKWPKGIFDDRLEDVKKLTALPNMRHSFLSFRMSPNKRLRWDDDDAWATLENNLSILADFAKRSGLKGIGPDWEDYLKQRQYWLAVDDPEYETTCELARSRARQIFGAIFGAYPDMTVLQTYFTFSQGLSKKSLEVVSLSQKLKEGRSLWAHFINGMLDVLPPGARIAAAEEDYKQRAATCDFYKAYADRRRRGIELIEPENRNKFTLQVSYGFDLYLDGYAVDKKSQWYMSPDGYDSPCAALLADLAQATAAADEYVWFWEESRSLLKWRDLGVASKRTDLKRFSTCQTWDELFPGLYDGMASIKDPEGYARKAIVRARADGAKNLAKNHGCETTEGFSLWQSNEKAGGTMSVDASTGYEKPSALVLTGVRGCAVTNVGGMSKGDSFAIRLVAKAEGDAAASACIYWKDASGWRFDLTGRQLASADADRNGWREYVAFVTCPEGATGFGLQLGSCARPGQRVFFDDIEIYRVR